MPAVQQRTILHGEQAFGRPERSAYKRLYLHRTGWRLGYLARRADDDHLIPLVAGRKLCNNPEVLSE